jgi:transcriptional regulator GlxA family with amidase domain
VERARNYIAANVATNFSLETLGAATCANRYDLCRRFQRQVGMPPHRFRAHLRVARARELLATGLECTKVAHEAGFCDQSHLNRAFKEHTGTTPGAYARTGERESGPGGQRLLHATQEVRPARPMTQDPRWNASCSRDRP